MGAFLSTLGFNQPFFLTIVGILVLLGVTVTLVQEESSTENGKDTRALLGGYRNKIDLRKPTPHPYSSDLNSTHIA